MEWNGMEWNGMEWNGMEWNGMEWIGMKQNETERNRTKQNETERNRMKQTRTVSLCTERNGAEREEEIEIELKRKRFSISLHAQTERNGMGTRSGVERRGNNEYLEKLQCSHLCQRQSWNWERIDVYPSLSLGAERNGER